jgi:hypothetical protein
MGAQDNNNVEVNGEAKALNGVISNNNNNSFDVDSKGNEEKYDLFPLFNLNSIVVFFQEGTEEYSLLNKCNVLISFSDLLRGDLI